MEFIQTKLDGVVIVEPKVFGDHRGFFMESYSKREFEKAGLFYEFVQDNHSSSTAKGTLRGIHFQRGDKAQAKLGWAPRTTFEEMVQEMARHDLELALRDAVVEDAGFTSFKHEE